MIESTCMCAVVLSGETMNHLVAVGIDHWGSEHPQYELTPVSIRNYFEAEQRIDGPTERLDEIGEITVVPVGPELSDDVLEFFDRRVFAGNPAWGMCYCMFHHFGGRYAGDWPQRTWQQNRSDLVVRIEEGTTTGVVAYVDGVLAGWCNATERGAFPSLSEGDDQGVGSIVCFAVAPPYRGHGVSRRMLSAALALLTSEGLSIAEAYPVAEAPDGASGYVGTVDLYLEAGFEVFSEKPLIVRKPLT